VRRVFYIWSWETEEEPTTESRLLSLAIRLGLYVAALWLAGQWVRGVEIEGWPSLVAMAAILWAVNATVQPVAQLAGCAVTCLTLGLFALVINAAMLALAAWIAGILDFDVEVDGFWAALLGALLIVVVVAVLDNALGRPLRRALR
jgi:putative membrane protein